MSDTDAIFAEMVADLDMPESDEVFVDYRKLTRVELSSLFNRTRTTLSERGELLLAHSDAGRDLGAVYHGCLFEMRRRGML